MNKTVSYCHIYGQLDQTGDRLPEELAHLFGLKLVCDTSVRFPQAARHREALQELHARGGLVAPNIYPADLDKRYSDPNWWKYSEAQCLELLGIAKERFEALGLGPMVAVNTYTTGNSFVKACRKLEIRTILGFCAPTVIEDGGWEIAHYGSPLSPYFISDEDFRKPEAPGRSDAVMMVSMELRNPMVCLSHWSEGPWCPLNALAADRWLEPSEEPLPFIQIAEDWLRQAELSGVPKFFHINLQYFFAGECYPHNRRALEWLSEQRDKGRLEIGGIQPWAEKLKSGGGFVRQTTYWRGEMMGFHVGHRPGCFPDVIVDEALEAQRIWQSPDPLPRRFYDYQKPWDWPAFEPKGSAPASVDFSGVSVQVAWSDLGHLEKQVEIEIDNSGPLLQLPVALWDGCEGWEGPYELTVLSDGWTARMAPHPAGAGGAVLMEGPAATGISRVTARVKGSALSTFTPHKSWGGLVDAQTFFYQGRPYTVLAARTPEAFELEATIHGASGHSEPVVIEHLMGLDHGKGVMTDGRALLRFNGLHLACWHRFWGVTAGQIDLAGVDEVLARLRQTTSKRLGDAGCSGAVPEPGFQLFGNLREQSRWDRPFARMAGETERQRMNEWFRQQRPEAGEVVVEAHPGIYLPRGSITKVLGHEFDMQACAAGYAFREICVDYPQGWDWGVAAWVQWRHLRLRLDGLTLEKGRYLLHLHAFDPESRGFSQEVHFFNPEGTEAAPLLDDASAPGASFPIKKWALPAGIEGRWHPTALYTVPIPDACLDWPSVGIWVVPQAPFKLDHWIKERGCPGVLSHLWLTRL